MSYSRFFPSGFFISFYLAFICSFSLFITRSFFLSLIRLFSLSFLLTLPLSLLRIKKMHNNLNGSMRYHTIFGVTNVSIKEYRRQSKPLLLWPIWVRFDCCFILLPSFFCPPRLVVHHCCGKHQPQWFFFELEPFSVVIAVFGLITEIHTKFITFYIATVKSDVSRIFYLSVYVFFFLAIVPSDDSGKWIAQSKYSIPWILIISSNIQVPLPFPYTAAASFKQCHISNVLFHNNNQPPN